MELGDKTPSGRTEKKATIVAQTIVDAIVEAGLEPGAKLPPEADMLASYGVGRGTLREALRLLETQGVVRIRTGPGGGPIVRRQGAGPMASNLALYLQRAAGSFRDVMAVRQVIEPEIAAYAARHQPDLGAELLAQAGAHQSRTGPGAFVGGAADFHDAVAKCTGNPLFEAILGALHLITEPVVQSIEHSTRRRRQLYASHRAIAAAIAEGDADAARAEMRRDLDEFVRHAERARPTVLDNAIRWRFTD